MHADFDGRLFSAKVDTALQLKYRNLSHSRLVVSSVTIVTALCWGGGGLICIYIIYQQRERERVREGISRLQCRLNHRNLSQCRLAASSVTITTCFCGGT
jgi:hypothetical protein